MEYVIDYARKNEYKSIHFTCLENEKEVHRFYESAGFVKVSSRKYNMYL